MYGHTAKEKEGEILKKYCSTVRYTGRGGHAPNAYTFFTRAWSTDLLLAEERFKKRPFNT
jgi:hypothetical protein